MMKRKSLAIVALSTAIFVFVSTGFGQAEGGAIAAIDEPAESSGGGAANRSGKYGTTVKTPAKAGTVKRAAAKPRPAPARPRAWNGFVIGDEYTLMNFEVISAEKPYYTREAKAGGASGLVQVVILIDSDGRVIQARARTGNKLLHAEAERAALASRFNRPAVYGKPARALGFLVYRFGASKPESRLRPKQYERQLPFNNGR